MLVANRGIDDPRVCMEAAALQACGRYDVTVLGWDRETDRDIVQHQGGVEFRRLALRSTHARGATQAAFLAGYYLCAWPHLRALRPVVIHCHDLDTLALGARSAACIHSRLVFDAHENYPDMMQDHLPAAMVSLLRRAERYLVPRADLLITVGGRLAEFYRELGARQVTIVGNWKDSDSYRQEPSHREQLRRELGLNGQVAIAYIAALGRDRHLEPLLAAVAADTRFACVIGGTGCLQEVAIQYASRYPNIRYLGHVPPPQVAPLTAACDVVYYGMDCGNPNSRWSAPNKLYEAIAAGKPILAGDFGEVGPTVRNHGCGVLAATESAAGIARGLERLADRDALSQMAVNATALQSQYSARAARLAVVDAYAGLCKGNVVPAPPGVPVHYRRISHRQSDAPANYGDASPTQSPGNALPGTYTANVVAATAAREAA